ncbi:transposase family protein [Streptomyces sp. NEAU-W12]|uniref:transposase family protein n=1 Tax=Streptomyces sp. NEAU-W12 TaxID=2994668 RepID=UPI002B0620CF|nr:hypothetical protein [Streptomyces sp. NEAU-W12]
MCPVCGVWPNRVHDSCLRFPADVPSGGRSVVLQLRDRRFACGNSGCTRRTFVEQIPGLALRHGHGPSSSWPRLRPRRNCSPASGRTDLRQLSRRRQARGTRGTDPWRPHAHR